MIRKSKSFIDEGFLLDSPFALELYVNYAAKQPIIDYHCHLSPAQISNNYQFKNITEIWIEGDHYKWRAMRTLGVDERFITGDASPKEKFITWASCVPKLVRNPLYHWTHLELKRYFGIDELLNVENAAAIYERTSALLHQSDYSCLNLIKKSGVEIICTTDDPIDSLEHHKVFGVNDSLALLPSFRPDKFIEIQQEEFIPRLAKLGMIVGYKIDTFNKLKKALDNRMDYFASHGCRISDHGLEQIPYTETSDEIANAVMQKKAQGKVLNAVDLDKYKTAVLLFLANSYHKRGWVQQYHLGALRNNNSRMLNNYGTDIGCDSIGDFRQAQSLSRFLDTLDSKNELAKTILYNLDPAQNAIFATMAGNFNDGSMGGKIQFGASWWFLDQLDGIRNQINTLSNMGVLSTFIGMLTDSRSFMSYPRHEYFRRVLCNIFGEDVEKGLLPRDLDTIGTIVSDICYHNAKSYFNFYSKE
ncbi:MAG: glucuronate isomerase [Flavobacteriaceae bacterium]